MQGYEQDFHAWTQRTAALLRAGRFEEADIEHVAEEIEDMGRRDVRELKNRVRVYVRAVKRAVAETGLSADRFPPVCPYRVDQILDEDFLP